jgi:hypothetical protein
MPQVPASAVRTYAMGRIEVDVAIRPYAVPTAVPRPVERLL